MSNNCSLWVSGDGKYCCVNKVFKVSDHAITLAIANVGGVDLLMFPTGDTDDVPIVVETLEDGVHTLSDAGVYKLDLDCELYDGEVAPTDVMQQAAACHTVITHSSANDIAMIEKLCAILDALAVGTDTGALMTVIDELKALCQKVIDQTTLNTQQNEKIIECLETLKDQIVCEPATPQGVKTSWS